MYCNCSIVLTNQIKPSNFILLLIVLFNQHISVLILIVINLHSFTLLRKLLILYMILTDTPPLQKYVW